MENLNKRNRCSNFSIGETEILIELVQKQKNFIGMYIQLNRRKFNK